MKISSFDAEIQRFLSNREPEVLVVSGKWGVGKTFSWNRNLDAARNSATIKFDHYSYISLFGLSSLADLKAAVWQTATPIGKKIELAGSNALDAALAKLDSFARNSITPLSSLTSLLKIDSGSILQAMGNASISEQLICFDDLERRSKGLDLTDILGFVSYLKEQKRCKVVILLNDEQLGSDQGDFQAQLEKVSDNFLRFEPSPMEAATFVTEGNQLLKSEIVECCTKLGLINIRTIKRIEKATGRIYASLGNVDRRIVSAVVRNLSILIFSKYHPLDAPPLSYLRTYSRYYIGPSLKDVELANPQWRMHASSVDFEWEGEFSDTLTNYVFAGYLDQEALEKSLRPIEAKFQLADKRDAYHQAWQSYHWSIENDCDLVLEKFEAAIREMPDVISPADFDGTIITMRELGWQGDFSELISSYVDARSDETQAFWKDSIENFGQPIKDLEVSRAYRLKSDSYQEQLSAKEALMFLADGWNSLHVEFLARQSVDEIVSAYRELSSSGPRELKLAIQGGLRYRNVVNRSPTQDIVNGRIIEALSVIAQDNSINARRLERHGIPPLNPHLDPKPPAV